MIEPPQPRADSREDFARAARRAWPALEFYFQTEVDSTMEEARRLLGKGAQKPFVILADLQTLGRGRRGGGWISPPGVSLLMTLALEIPTAAAANAMFAIALAIAQGVEEFAPAASRPMIKWPNDILSRGRKICGMLAECEGGAILVGAGINILQRADQLPPAPAASRAASSILLEREAAGWPEAPDRSAIFERVLEEIRVALEKPPSEIPQWDRVRARCSTLGRRVRIENENAPAIEGVAGDLDENGALLVRTREGSLARCLSGHVVEMDASGAEAESSQ